MCLLAAGCAASQRQSPRAQRPAEPEYPEYPEYIEASASALAFDSPVGPDGPMPELARAPRAPSAYVGFEDTIAEYFYVRMDDRQSNDCSDGFERRAISEKVGVRYR